MKQGYGYNIYKVYISIFPKATMRSIYYHLNKGIETGEFKIKSVKSEKGNYSWGPSAEKVYYSLGKSAEPKISKRVKNYFDKMYNKAIEKIQGPKKVTEQKMSKINKEKEELLKTP